MKILIVDVEPTTNFKFSDSTQSPGLITATGVAPNLSLAVGLTEITKGSEGLNGFAAANSFTNAITGLNNIVVSGTAQSLPNDFSGSQNFNTFASAVNTLGQQEAQVTSPNTDACEAGELWNSLAFLPHTALMGSSQSIRTMRSSR
jgi:hypothetical protein